MHEVGLSCMVVMASNSEHDKNSSKLGNEECDRIPAEGNNPLLNDNVSNDSVVRDTDENIEINLQEEDPTSNGDEAAEENNKSLRMSPEQLHPVQNADDSECLQQPPVVSDCLLPDTANKSDELDAEHDNIQTKCHEGSELSTMGDEHTKMANLDQDVAVMDKDEDHECRQPSIESDSHQHSPPKERQILPGSPAADDGAQEPHCDIPGPSRLDPSDSFYFLKRFRWKGEQVQIVTQNENGPCPLLAIANVLILSKRVAIPSIQECITANQIMEYIGDYILSSGPQNANEAVILNYQQNMHDAISIMYKLQTGIDVNVKFTGPRNFELTPECLVFDILNIGLYHGWLIDPQDSQISNAVGNLSYNQLVEKIIESKDKNSSEAIVREGLLAESFLEQNASQLTYHGLCELNSEIKEEELCVFFRNNHFNTLYKFKGKLYLLVTDQGYLNQSKIIWETLADVDGESQFVNEAFEIVGPLTTPESYSNHQSQTQNELSQEDRDYLIALSLQEEGSPSTNETTSSQMSEQSDDISRHQEQQDLELARRLQEQEDRIAREGHAIQQQQSQQHRVQQQQSQSRQSHNQQLSRQHPPGGVQAENRSDKCNIL